MPLCLYRAGLPQWSKRTAKGILKTDVSQRLQRKKSHWRAESNRITIATNAAELEGVLQAFPAVNVHSDPRRHIRPIRCTRYCILLRSRIHCERDSNERGAADLKAQIYSCSEAVAQAMRRVSHRFCVCFRSQMSARLTMMRDLVLAEEETSHRVCHMIAALRLRQSLRFLRGSGIFPCPSSEPTDPVYLRNRKEHISANHTLLPALKVAYGYGRSHTAPLIALICQQPSCDFRSCLQVEMQQLTS